MVRPGTPAKKLRCLWQLLLARCRDVSRYDFHSPRVGIVRNRATRAGKGHLTFPLAPSDDLAGKAEAMTTQTGLFR